jgi:hypothetical protein
MKKIGCTAIALGLGALILPFLGLQFKIINLMAGTDNSVQAIAVILIIGGVIMFFLSGFPQLPISQTAYPQKPNKKYPYTPELKKFMQSGLAQGIMTEIAFGTDPEILVENLISVGSSKAKAEEYVYFLVETFDDASEEQREALFAKFRENTEIIDKALSNGTSPEKIVDELVEHTNLNESQAGSLVHYWISKRNNESILQ